MGRHQARAEVSESMPAPSAVVFDVIHDYARRLEWDTLLSAAYIDDGAPEAGKGVITVCVGRVALGRIALERDLYLQLHLATALPCMAPRAHHAARFPVGDAQASPFPACLSPAAGS